MFRIAMAILLGAWLSSPARAHVANDLDGHMVLRLGGGAEATPAASVSRVVLGDWGVCGRYTLFERGDWSVGPDLGMSFGAGARPWGGWEVEGPLYFDLLVQVGARAHWRYSSDVRIGARLGWSTGTSAFRGQTGGAFGVGVAGPDLTLGALSGSGQELKGVEVGAGFGSGSQTTPYWHFFAAGFWPRHGEGLMLHAYLLRLDLRTHRGSGSAGQTEGVVSFGWALP